MKGYNAQEVGRIVAAKWGAFRDPAGIGLDASRFDQHCSKVALQWEHSVYYQVFPRNRLLRRLLSWQILNKGRGYVKDGRVKYQVEGCRMSGDMNTALGNCLIMCGLVWGYADALGINIQLINNGDDCVVFMERADVNRFREGLDTWFLEMGYSMKVEDTVYELEHVEFCQTKPVWTPQGCLMVRNPHIAVAKDCFSIHALDRYMGAAKQLTVLAAGGLSLTGGLPVWQSFYRLLARNWCGVVESNIVPEGGMAIMSHRMERKISSVHHMTRYSFWRAFGILPDAQLELEAYYDRFQLQWKPPAHREHTPLPWWPAPD
jgi:hypothetical protein